MFLPFIYKSILRSTKGMWPGVGYIISQSSIGGIAHVFFHNMFLKWVWEIVHESFHLNVSARAIQ